MDGSETNGESLPGEEAEEEHKGDRERLPDHDSGSNESEAREPASGFH